MNEKLPSRNIKSLLLGEFSVKRLMRSVIFIYACLCLWAYFFAEGKIFFPQPSSYQDNQDIIKLTASDGVQISAVYLPNPQAKYTLLFSHGNAEDLGYLRSLLLQLRNMGFSVFAYDYHGYGTSGGKPSEINTYRDIDAGYNYLTQKLGISPNRIIAYGRSVGTGPTVDLASRQRLAGLILESPFISAFRVVTRIPIVPFDKFNNLDKIKKINCPLLIMHGKADEVIPFAHGQQLYASALEPKQFFEVETATHNDVMLVAGTEYIKKIQQFISLIEKL